jgi:hypothetical protein
MAQARKKVSVTVPRGFSDTAASEEDAPCSMSVSESIPSATVAKEGGKEEGGRPITLPEYSLTGRKKRKE